ncbi:MAG: histidinol dehydrogenase [Clostridia bacterium]|nr:histidinol dehydrogenase [Clostridia bacterium]
MIPLYKWPSTEAQERIKSKAYIDAGIQAKVAQIVEDVQENGDKALLCYTLIFDGCSLKKADLRVSEEEIEEAYQQVDADFLSYLRQAKENIFNFHLRQKRQDWLCEDETTGSYTGQIFRPLQRVGIYVPGGKASYPSTVLMTVLPAMVAGVPEIVMVTPPGKEGIIPPATLVAAKEAGATEIYRVGGAQAIAALAYGTDSIAAVDKIVGPGNIFVALAKKIVYGVVGIDMIAGPSEILIIGDGSVKAEYAAADLLSQAEHDQRARAILVTNNSLWAEEVRTALEQQLSALPRQEIARVSLKEFGAVIITESLEEAFAIANDVAPEHLELLLSEPQSYLEQVRNAGAIFLGPYTPESLGDYWAGPSHVLPTGGTARYASPLSVEDFCKRSSILNYSLAGLRFAIEPIEYLASIEGLFAHGQALSIRDKGEKNE